MKKINGFIETRNESPEKSLSRDVSSLKSSTSQNSVLISNKQQSTVKNSTIKYSQKLRIVPTNIKVLVNKKLVKNECNVRTSSTGSSNNDLIDSKVNKKQQRLMKFSTPKLSITKRVSQMQKYIQELKLSNKDLKYENEYLRKAALRNFTNFICAKELQEELQQAGLKSKELEAQLNQKNDIIEKYQLLLREISSNVNILMKELEYDNKSDDIQMQKKLKKLSQIKQKSDLLALNPKSLNNYQVFQLQHEHLNENTFSSSSDTLIDADLSFETSTRSNSQEPRVADYQFRPIKPAQYKVPSTLSSFDGSLSMENNCMSNQEDDYNDDDNSFTLSLDDMSITTIPTSEIQNSDQNDSSANLSHNEDFQHGLNELDQKIFKAKMLLESIKIK
jgi:hypothetical protein